MYNFDELNSNVLDYNTTTKKVSKIYDQMLAGSDAIQTTSNNQPSICAK